PRPVRLVAATVLVAAGLLATLAVAPVSAAAPERVDEPIFLVFPDFDNGLVVFWNTTREAFCAWEENDFEGDSPALELVTATYNETSRGPVIFRWAAMGHLELWTLDDDADGSGACPDTDGSSELWATGTARVAVNDNDLDHDASVEAGLRRTNAFGDRGHGTVWDAHGGTWQYGWIFHALRDNEGGTRVPVERSFLHPIR
ncbi:MAG: hypothetical protein H0U86_03845, partial [Chloroflexi bacterium]|nr:hypothetical protein [Chloroflexota bacterium]